MFSKLRKKYPVFYYQDYDWKIKNNNLVISFNFEINSSINFHPKIIIKNVEEKNFDKKLIDNLVFHLGLIEMISYWKATCSPIIKIKTGKLNQKQIDWWKDLIIRGLGEFFYQNKINWKIDNFLKIKTNNEKKIFKASKQKLKKECLIPISGGKDSIVSLELLKDKQGSISFTLNPNPTTKKIFKISGFKKIVEIERRIDPKLIELNRKGFLNGHTPFSAYLSFLSLLIGYLFDKKYIVLSNERSSNEGNLNYLGTEINHQYSKTYRFEKKFRKYYKKNIINDAEYFSFLRPLYELQITRLFSEYEKYFPFFSSCNKTTEAGKWCRNCPKCLFLFMALYPFLKKEKIISFFGENLFEKKEALILFKKLIGEGDYFKPFECVGTKQESLVAAYLSWEKEKENLPFLLNYFEKNVLIKNKNLKKKSKKILRGWDKNNSLPKKFEKII